MKVLLGGIRGTGPVTSRAFLEFGGDTTSFLVEGSRHTQLVIDMGTGIRLIDHHIRRKRDNRRLLIMLTHYHLDHLMGIPSFSLLYNEAWSLRIAGPRLSTFTAEEVIHRMLAKPFWPLQIDAMRAAIEFVDLDPDGGTPIVHGELTIRWHPVRHPGGGVAYRIDEPATGDSVVIATDIEWQESSVEEQQSFLSFCRAPAPVSLLLFDGQFTNGIYNKYRQWGHSTWQDAVQVADAAGAAKLAVIHHAPGATDNALQQVETKLRQAKPGAELGRQGVVFETAAFRKTARRR